MTWHGKQPEDMTDEELREAAAMDPLWADYVRTRQKTGSDPHEWNF